MGDNRTRYNRVRTYLDKVFEKPGGNKARFLNTLAAIISGIVGSGSCQLPKIAERIPGNAKPASVGKRIKRWIDNENTEWEFFFCLSPCCCCGIWDFGNLFWQQTAAPWDAAASHLW